MDDKTIRVLVVEPTKPCRVQEIGSDLESMQAIVGGYIEEVTPFDEPVAIVCNEEGKLNGLPLNRPLTDQHGMPYDFLFGTFFVAGVEGEHFVSLTEEQIQKYTALYDNMVVLIVERSDTQTEITPNAAISDFAVSCKISFRITREDQSADTQKDAFIDHVTGIFNGSETLADRTVGGLDFTFCGRCAEVQYTFARQDKDESSAESFSEQCVRKVQDQLEGYGCKIEKVACVAEKLENDLSCAKNRPRGQEPQGKKKKGSHHER